MQETSHWPTHRWNVMSEQRKSDWQHPNSYYRKREETEHAAADESDTSRHPQPFRTIPTKAVQVMADPGRDVILEALHFLVEIGNPHHRFIPMVARRSTTAWEIIWSRPTEVLDGHCVPFARPKYRRQPLGPPNGRFWPTATDVAPQPNVRFRKYSVSRRRPVYSPNTRRAFRSAFRPQSRWRLSD
jgi:hypothetical protein